MADRAAAMGVSRHSLTDAMIKEWKEQLKRTTSQQIMMVAIIDARFEAERSRGGNPDFYGGDQPEDSQVDHDTATSSQREPLIQEVPTTIEALRHRFPMFLGIAKLRMAIFSRTPCLPRSKFLVPCREMAEQTPDGATRTSCTMHCIGTLPILSGIVAHQTESPPSTSRLILKRPLAGVLPTTLLAFVLLRAPKAALS